MMNAARSSGVFVFCDATKKISEIFFGAIRTSELGWQLGELHTIRLGRRATTRER
jgi:hypothetical protein